MIPPIDFQNVIQQRHHSVSKRLVVECLRVVVMKFSNADTDTLKHGFDNVSQIATRRAGIISVSEVRNERLVNVLHNCITLLLGAVAAGPRAHVNREVVGPLNEVSNPWCQKGKIEQEFVRETSRPHDRGVIP